MRPMPVVSVQPDRQRSGAVIRGGVGLSVGPFAQGGLDEALSLAVCLGRIGLGPDVLETEIAAGGAKRLGAKAGAIVGHHTGNRDAEARARSKPRSPGCPPSPMPLGSFHLLLRPLSSALPGTSLRLTPTALP